MDLSLHPSFGKGFLNFRCESEVIINFPPLNKWTNRTCQLKLETILTLHKWLYLFVHGKV